MNSSQNTNNDASKKQLTRRRKIMQTYRSYKEICADTTDFLRDGNDELIHNLGVNKYEKESYQEDY